jgi:hypothetical protein
MERGFGEKGRLNVVALSEMMLEYYRLVDHKVVPEVPGVWQHRIVAARFADEPPRKLAPGVNPAFPLIGAGQRASTNDWNMTWTAHGDPEQDA